MKGVIRTVVLVMMVSILFGVSASASGRTSKNVTHRQVKQSAEKGFKGKSLKNKNNKKKRKAADSAVNAKEAYRLKPIVKNVNNIAAESGTNNGSNSKRSEMEGKVIEQLPNAKFRVELKNGSTVIAYISGKLRTNFIRIRFGDRVLVEISSDQPDRGRIIWRYKH